MTLDSLRLLLRIRQHGTLAGAARAMGVDPSSVSRALSAIEAELGLRVFQRTTRRLTVTEDGARVLTRLGPLVDEISDVLDDARDQRRRASGRLRITASVAFGEVCLVPLLPEFRRLYPDVSIDLLLTDARLDIVAEAVDLAIRLVPAPEGDLMTTRLMSTRYHVCAAPDYLARMGHPEKPEDLSAHECLQLTLADHGADWRFHDPGGHQITVPVRGDVRVSNPLALRSATRIGLGPAMLADWLVREDLETGRLVDLFPGWQATATSFDTGAWLLYPSRAYLPAKTRAMIDFLKAASA